MALRVIDREMNKQLDKDSKLKERTMDMLSFQEAYRHRKDHCVHPMLDHLLFQKYF